MVAAGAMEVEELLLRSVEAENEGGGGLFMEEQPWRLNFDGFRRLEAQQERLARGLHDFLGVLAQGPADGIAQYYQEQRKLLEKFGEMDTLTNLGFLPAISTVMVMFACLCNAWPSNHPRICMLIGIKYEFCLTKQQEKWLVNIMLSVTLLKLLLVKY